MFFVLISLISCLVSVCWLLLFLLVLCLLKWMFFSSRMLLLVSFLVWVSVLVLIMFLVSWMCWLSCLFSVMVIGVSDSVGFGLFLGCFKCVVIIILVLVLSNVFNVGVDVMMWFVLVMVLFLLSGMLRLECISILCFEIFLVSRFLRFVMFMVRVIC